MVLGRVGRGGTQVLRQGCGQRALPVTQVEVVLVVVVGGSGAGGGGGREGGHAVCRCNITRVQEGNEIIHNLRRENNGFKIGYET